MTDVYETYRKAQSATDPNDDIPGHSPICLRSHQGARLIWTRTCAWMLTLSGMTAGWLSGLLGVGGGFVMVPALQRFSDLPMQSVVSTSLAAIALISLTGIAPSAAFGVLNWAIAFPYSAGAVTGMVVGRVVSPRLSAHHLQVGFSALALIVAFGMVAKTVL